MEFNVTWKNWQQAAFYYSTKRNQCFSGGLNSGKTFVICLKALTLLLAFSNYRVIIARQVYKDLKNTTMQTFLSMIPSELVASHNEQDGITTLVNGSLIWWMHLDKVDENSLRGIEPNSIFVDQGEEVSEAVFLALDSRVGRWAGAIVPPKILQQQPNWPLKDNKPIIPSYFCIGCNPDTEFHFIYRKYHPESLDVDPDYFFVQSEWDPSMGSEESYIEALKRDPEWVDKFVRGKWGSSSSAIHFLRPDSILTPDMQMGGMPILDYIREKGNLSRVMDHGSSAPTCCGWGAAIKGVYIFYREYYQANKTISFHRREIANLSEGEIYQHNYADPHIFDKASQAKGGLFSVADEYTDSSLGGDPIFWQKADNNEFATRNRINELLIPTNLFRHPVTGLTPAPGLYFIKATPEYPNGCNQMIQQLGAQRKTLIGNLDGKNIYSEERDDKIVDHGYDVVRYYVSMHGVSPKEHMKRPARNSFAFYQAVLKKMQMRERSHVA